MTVELELTCLFSYAAADQQPQAGDQQRMLHGQYPQGQRFGGVTGLHRHAGLGKHGAGIQFGHHEVHAGAVLGITGFQRARMRVQPLVQRQQGGMDVDQAAIEPRHEGRAEDAHVTGADDPVRGERVQRIGHRRIEGGAVREVPGRARPALGRADLEQGRGLGFVREHGHDLRIQPLRGDGVQDGLQIAAPAGGEYGDTAAHAVSKAALTAGRDSTTRVNTPSAVPNGMKMQAIPATTMHSR